ncbi:MAG: ankyrin repeat domain-containing protein [Proteobacteria bacterium]|nr:ankyrin repeat domain-containing protein [Pseudomonadota bacterium]MCP4917355.1 ankyrin repeat domain-containing protein [Pseudomonadota bacterium]
MSDLYRSVQDARPDEGEPPALRTLRLDAVRALLAAGADVEAKGHRGETALFPAAQDATLCRLLLQHGADVHAVDDHGMTALHEAVANGSL